MADGTKKVLQDIQVGDEVASWDEASQSVVGSVVKAVPAFLRTAAELVELSLPHALFYATQDHPFWSRGKRGLVSAHPNQTLQEYGLAAELFESEGEELEVERNGSTRAVLGRWRRAAPVSLRARLLGRRLSAAADSAVVEVATLCLQPFHWFYVHGVRVHNKGCFTKTAEVSMADGTRKQLQHVRPGDEVASWDDSRHRLVKSVVKVVPTYLRDAAELVEIQLPHAQLHATDDHPFWSRSRGTLVSARPNRTMQEYGLPAEAMSAGEEFQGERSEGIRLLDVRPLRAEAALLRSRRLDGGGAREEVEVATLCLHPFHWFFVHGVRVHNKGCFAPWVRVLLSNGTQVPISRVRPEDRVASWDSERAALSEARVLGVEAFPVGEQLLRVEFRNETPGVVVGAAARRPVGSGGLGLVLTADHPVYSSRWRGVVSMRPDGTLASYGIVAGQMLERELLSHHLGHDVEALVQLWHGEVPPSVMTLRLDRHHWFYAEGIRVHNKGVGGGSGGGGGRAIGTRSRGYFTSDHAFTYFILAQHMRRRRGYWRSDDDGCRYNGSYSDRADVQALCDTTVGEMSACGQCDDCPGQDCMDSIKNCSVFLSSLYQECDEATADDTWVWVVLTIVGFCGCFYCLATCEDSQPAALAERARLRERLQGHNGPGLGRVRWDGTYSENGETKHTEYLWVADAAGRFTGTSTDDDGTAQVWGTLCLPVGALRRPGACTSCLHPGESGGQIAWREERPGVRVEAEGSIMAEHGLFGGQPTFTLEANYLSDNGTQGSVQLRSIEAQVGAVQASAVAVVPEPQSGGWFGTAQPLLPKE